MEKQIRFVDSSYNELFRIPDGGQIVITYENGDRLLSTCKYVDDYHTEIDGRCYHLIQWAQFMEQNGRSYVPAEKPKFILQDIEQSEFEFMYAKENENEDRGCIGHLRADFDTGKSFFSTWWPENDALKTQEFKDEFDEIINYFRKESATPILRSCTDMLNLCYRLNPTQSETNRDVHGFKVVTEKHTYYLRCNPRLGEYNLYAYCYNNQALNRFKNTRFVEEHFDEVNQEKFYKTDYGYQYIYFNPDSSAGGQLVYDEFTYNLIREAAKQDNIANFFAYLHNNCKQTLVDIDSSEFIDYLKEFMEQDCDSKKETLETANAMIKVVNEERRANRTTPER